MAFDPRTVQDTATLATRLRQLKQKSGLTLRELEERARAEGDFLARSTVSDVLRGARLPTHQTLRAFVRACGEEETGTRAWLEARQRIEDGPADEPPDPGSAVGPDPPPAGPSDRTRSWVVAGASVTGLVAVCMWTLSAAAGPLPPSSKTGSSAETRAPETEATEVTEPVTLRGWKEVRSAVAPYLCLTEGRDRRGEYLNAVAALLPCEEARPPHTYLRPVGPATSPTSFLIEWHHPQHGRGCLTLRREGAGKDLVEPWPWKSCDPSRTYQQFRIERVGRANTQGSKRYRFRLEGTQRCVGIRDDSTEAGAEVAVEPCSGVTDQQFLIQAAA